MSVKIIIFSSTVVKFYIFSFLLIDLSVHIFMRIRKKMKYSVYFKAAFRFALQNNKKEI